ncbi:MAG: hypothetical protein WAO95_00935 [Burkholderiales bacterium]
MKSIAWLILTLAFFALPLHAQSAREQLNQLVTQLRSNPGDVALRERIIKLAQEIKSPPAVPEEAERRLGRGRAAFETAKDAADFEKAIVEFVAATNAAPWLAAPYYNLGLAQEKAKRYREAMASMRLYLQASPGSPDTSEVRQRIFSLEYLAEQPPPAPKPPSDDELLGKLNGARFVLTSQHTGTDSQGDNFYEVSGRQLVYGQVARSLGPNDRQFNAHILNSPVRFTNVGYDYKGGLKWERPYSDSCSGAPPGCVSDTFEATADGRQLIVRFFRRYDRSVQTLMYPRSN